MGTDEFIRCLEWSAQMLANWTVIAENWPLFCEAPWNFLVADVTFEWLSARETSLMLSECWQEVHLW